MKKIFLFIGTIFFCIAMGLVYGSLLKEDYNEKAKTRAFNLYIELCDQTDLGICQCEYAFYDSCSLDNPAYYNEYVPKDSVWYNTYPIKKLKSTFKDTVIVTWRY